MLLKIVCSSSAVIVFVSLWWLDKGRRNLAIASSYPVTTNLYTSQIEQDMALLMKTSVPNPKATFFEQWTTVYVPAILGYAEKSKRKSVVGLLGAMNKTGKLQCQSRLVYFTIPKI